MATGWSDYRTPRGRALLWASEFVVVCASVVLAIAVGRHWQWGPFAVGIVVGIFGVAVYALLILILIRAVRPDPRQLDEARHRLRLHRLAVLPGYGCFGISVGVISGSLGSYWPDVVLAVMILVLGFLIPIALLPFLMRKASAARDRTDS